MQKNNHNFVCKVAGSGNYGCLGIYLYWIKCSGYFCFAAITLVESIGRLMELGKYYRVLLLHEAMLNTLSWL